MSTLGGYSTQEVLPFNTPSYVFAFSDPEGREVQSSTGQADGHWTDATRRTVTAKLGFGWCLDPSERRSEL